jgi:hypothetical protein
LTHWEKTRGGTPLGDETTLILQNLWDLAVHRGMSWEDLTA